MIRSRQVLSSLIVLAVLCGPHATAAQAARSSASAAEPPPNSPFKPAFPGQTRAPIRALPVAFDVHEVASGLSTPWSLEFLPDGRMLVAERTGALRFIEPGGRLSPPGEGLPPVVARSQGGLFDVALDPDFATNRMIYWTYSEPRGGASGTALARGRLGEGPKPDVTDVAVLFRMQPDIASTAHYGGRIAFAPDGTLFLSLGERANEDTRGQARELGSHLGKVVRLNRDGSAPSDNPFAGTSGARPEIWSLGHRNPEGLVFRPGTDQLWAVEFGPRGGDELNRIDKGADYGWPTISYGINYDGTIMGGGETARPGLRQPVYYWDPAVSPSALLFYDGRMFPAWRGSLFVAALSGEKLVRLTLEGDRVVGEEWLLAGRGDRYRDVKQGPNGAIYLVAERGSVLRLTAKTAAP